MLVFSLNVSSSYLMFLILDKFKSLNLSLANIPGKIIFFFIKLCVNFLYVMRFCYCS